MHALKFLNAVAGLAMEVDYEKVERITAKIASTAGRIYIIGLGGSLANAIHMAADLRKLCEIDAEAFDNLAELTARANDEGLDSIFDGWLSRATEHDGLFVLSVGGGTVSVSPGIDRAVRRFPGWVGGIVGPVGGTTAEIGEWTIRVPAIDSWVTPLTESFQAVIWHCMVSDPMLQKNRTKW